MVGHGLSLVETGIRVSTFQPVSCSDWKIAATESRIQRAVQTGKSVEMIDGLGRIFNALPFPGRQRLDLLEL